MARDLSEFDLAAIISTDISTDGTLNGPNINALKEITINSKVPVIASGGIGSIAHLLSLSSLEDLGVTGVIVGRALYDETINLEEAIRSVSTPKIQDFSKDDVYLA